MVLINGFHPQYCEFMPDCRVIAGQHDVTGSMVSQAACHGLPYVTMGLPHLAGWGRWLWHGTRSRSRIRTLCPWLTQLRAVKKRAPVWTCQILCKPTPRQAVAGGGRLAGRPLRAAGGQTS